MMLFVEDPNQDTEWNDVLRAKGILPPRDAVEVTEEDLVNIVEHTIAEKSKGDSAGWMHNILIEYCVQFIVNSFVLHVPSMAICLQCFDAVVWAAGRASGL